MAKVITVAVIIIVAMIIANVKANPTPHFPRVCYELLREHNCIRPERGKGKGTGRQPDAECLQHEAVEGQIVQELARICGSRS